MPIKNNVIGTLFMVLLSVMIIDTAAPIIKNIVYKNSELYTEQHISYAEAEIAAIWEEYKRVEQALEMDKSDNTDGSFDARILFLESYQGLLQVRQDIYHHYLSTAK